MLRVLEAKLTPLDGRLWKVTEVFYVKEKKDELSKAVFLDQETMENKELILRE